MKQLAVQTIEWIQKVYQTGKTYFLIGYSPSNVSETITNVLAAASPDEQVVLISRFIDSKRKELSDVLVGSALVASLSAGLLSWNWFPTPPYTAKVSLLCALLHSLIGLGVATQQSVALSRVDIHPRRAEIIQRAVLAKSPTPSSSMEPKPSFWRSCAWQMGTMLLGNSVMFVVVGLCISVYAQAVRAAAWGPEVITAICFTISLSFGTCCFLISWFHVEAELQKAIQADAAISH